MLLGMKIMLKWTAFESQAVSGKLGSNRLDFRSVRRKKRCRKERDKMILRSHS